MIKLCSKLLLIFPLLKSAPTFTFLSLSNKTSLSTQLPKQLQNSLLRAFSLTTRTSSVSSASWAGPTCYSSTQYPLPGAQHRIWHVTAVQWTNREYHLPLMSPIIPTLLTFLGSFSSFLTACRLSPFSPSQVFTVLSKAQFWYIRFKTCGSPLPKSSVSFQGILWSSPNPLFMFYLSLIHILLHFWTFVHAVSSAEN